jgi:hypothetical protein
VQNVPSFVIVQLFLHQKLKVAHFQQHCLLNTFISSHDTSLSDY